MYCDLWSQYIQVRKLFKGGNYSRAETICGNTVLYFKPPKGHFLIYFHRAKMVFPRILITLILMKTSAYGHGHIVSQEGELAKKNHQYKKTTFWVKFWNFYYIKSTFFKPNQLCQVFYSLKKNLAFLLWRCW